MLYQKVMLNNVVLYKGNLMCTYKNVAKAKAQSLFAEMFMCFLKFNNTWLIHFLHT